MKYGLMFLALSAFWCGTVAGGSSQASSGSISGIITDRTGAVVAGARLTLSYAHSNIHPEEKATTSDVEGRYLFKDLREGQYDIWVENPPEFVHETKLNIAVGTGNTSVDFILRFAEGCDEAGGEAGNVSDVDKAEIVRLTLEDALVKKALPDFNLLVERKHDIIISMLNMSAAWIPRINGFKFISMSQAQIQQKADREGDFLYLSFARFTAKGSCVAVTLVNSWAVGKKSGMGYLSGGGSMYEYHKQGAKWIGKIIGGWIS